MMGNLSGGLKAYCAWPLFLHTSGLSGVPKALLLEWNGQLSCNTKKTQKKVCFGFKVGNIQLGVPVRVTRRNVEKDALSGYVFIYDGLYDVVSSNSWEHACSGGVVPFTGTIYSAFSNLVWSRGVVRESTYEAQGCADITRCAQPAHLRSYYTLILCFPKSETMASLPWLSLTAS